MATSTRRASLKSFVIQLMDCAAGVAVDDWVHQSLTVNNRAVTETGNVSTTQTIGMVKDKPSSTTCNVILHGVHKFTLGRGKMYLSTSGLATLTGPTTGFLQTLGFSFGNGDIYINPNYNRTKRT